jgi:hypothetical protein
MAVSPASEQNAVFTCWKQIAFYLGKGVRTVQRYEKRYGLPVRRPKKQPRCVYVSQHELDRWLATQGSEQSMNLASGESVLSDQSGNSAIKGHSDLSELFQAISEARENLQTLAEGCQTLLVRMKTRESVPANMVRRHVRQLDKTIMKTIKLIGRVGET